MDIALALGGGGARGNAHIGVLRVLEEQKIRIKAIAGTSIGGLIGAVYLTNGCSSKTIYSKFKSIDQHKLCGHLKGDEPSLLGLGGAVKFLNDLLGNATFSDLKIPFAVTAVDINSGKPIIIQEGKLIDAVLATIAVPGIFPARRWTDNSLLVDGGVLNPVPVSVARQLAPKLPVVAVVLSQPSDTGISLPVPEIPGAAPVAGYLSRLRITQALNVFLRSIDVEGKYLTELLLDLERPEVIIRPIISGIGLLDQVDIEEISGLGEIAAREALSDIRKVAGFSASIKRIFGKP